MISPAFITPLVPGYLVDTPFGPRMDFGKHKGEALQGVPVDYLRWCLREISDAPEEFSKIIRAELHRRQHEGVETFDFVE